MLRVRGPRDRGGSRNGCTQWRRCILVNTGFGALGRQERLGRRGGLWRLRTGLAWGGIGTARTWRRACGDGFGAADPRRWLDDGVVLEENLECAARGFWAILRLAVDVPHDPVAGPAWNVCSKVLDGNDLVMQV